MFTSAFRRFRAAEWRGWLPPSAMFLAMFAALLALGGDRGYFYRPGGSHDFISARSLALAENLSLRHNLKLARRIESDEGGGLRYDLYSRFPVGGHVLLKAATAPFGDDLAAKLLAARVLMLLMFCGAALLSYLAIARIADSRLVAFAATALGFSGFYVLWYSDGVFTEGVMDMFGVALAFHGMAVFVQEGRFRQLLLKTCAALLIGWHVYALLLPFIAFGFGGEALALLRTALSPVGGRRTSAALALLRSRYVVLAAVSIAFGASLLALNVLNEYSVSAGGGAPTLGAITRISGIADTTAAYGVGWDDMLRRQLYRVGASSVPYALIRAAGWELPMSEPTWDLAVAPTVLGIAATAAALGALAFVRRKYRALTATAVLFGFCWSLPFHYTSFHGAHGFEGLWYAALALALFAMILLGARRLLGERLGSAALIAAAALAAPVFALSVFLAGQRDRDPDEARLGKAMLADFQIIREMTAGKNVGFTKHRAEGRFVYWHLAGGERIINPSLICAREDADYEVSFFRDDSLDSLTPENRVAFLYRGEPLEICRAKRRRLEASEPAARAPFDIYIQDNVISYLKAPCARSDVQATFFARMHAVDADDLPPEHRQDGFLPIDNAPFWHRGRAFDGACLMTLNLPDYPISAVRAGQWRGARGGERIWETLAVPPLTAEALALYEDAYRAVAAGEPSARSGFDLYLNGDALAYLKEPCAESDARGRFFLSVHPIDVADLPADRRELGHASLNFDFAPPTGAVFNGKCMATVELPEYGIERIETGQWMPDSGERLWDAVIALGD